MNDTYHWLSKSFHWLIVAMLLVEFSVGWLMPEIRGGSPAALTAFHMEFGITILLVMLLRLAWRLIHGAPDPERSMPATQEYAARLMHYLLYATVIALPFTGWMLASARGWSVDVFGLFTMPPIVAASRSASRLADTLHVGLITIVCGLIVAHIAAALYHHVVLHDRVLQRMLP